MAEKNYLGVDGNYFGHRMLHGIRGKNPEFNLNTMQDHSNFAAALNESMLSIYASFNNDYHTLMDGFVFVFDNKSWRKDIEQYRPYYIDKDSEEAIGYKDNRTVIKDESPINWDEFDRLMNDFHERIKATVPCFRVIGCEGDDALLLLAEKLSANNINFWMFASDGDLAQIVNSRVRLFKNINSKDCPEGEFYLSVGIYKKLFMLEQPMDMLARMTQSNQDRDHFDKMFRVQLNGGRSRSNAVRVPGKGIKVARPLLTGLTKTICGDKKDNVFPICRWVKGGKNFKVTEKMIEEVWERSGYGKLSEENAQKFFLDKDMQLTTLLGLIAKAQTQTTEPIDKKSVGNHYKHNLKIIMLRREYIPEHVLQAFEAHYLMIKEQLFTPLSMQDLLRINLSVNTVDSATELIASSIPGIDIIGGTYQTGTGVPTPNTPVTQRSFIDDILNS
jgi:hypothetical protein